MKRAPRVRWSSVLCGLGLACITGAALAAQSQTGSSVPRPTLEQAVVGPDGFHRAVVMQGLDKITGRTTEFDAPLGVEVEFFKLRITARQCIARPPEETPETTAYLDVSEKTLDNETVKLFSGWMFASSPALNALEHAVYDVWVVSCKTDEPVGEAIPTPSLVPGREGESAPAVDETPVEETPPPADPNAPPPAVIPPPTTPPPAEEPRVAPDGFSE